MAKTTKKTMTNIHFILQGKGGVGKSFVACHLAQFLIAKNKNLLSIDIDPVNSTFHKFPDLKVMRIDVLRNDEIDSRKFDLLIENSLNGHDDVIIDSGSSSFVALASYLITNDVAAVFHDMGHKVTIHTVITGGEALLDTVSGFGTMLRQFPESVAFVVWLNPYHGTIEQDGKPFSEMKIYQDNKARIAGIVTIPEKKAETFGKDIETMLKAKLTYEQAQSSPLFNVMAKQRLKMYQRELFAAIDAGTAGV